ncbi:extracellular solute-binding protein [Paenibacillus sp. sptzw28]|uniref:extracellular solute-binding protein n=1 Tax=Paenibacillus sp. sptzw28 TaxID=715179 RepID=UPI001C6E6F29|nr:extracellular solute-binding protein [Paenibacillus sp. sptzw28]QYR21417.1 extracellular solute-binding protein [Paenibacillus sp. sptzw28]
MLRILRKYTVSIIAVCALIIFIIWWSQGRGFDDQAMAGVPEYKDAGGQSMLEEESYYSKLEPSFLKYYESMQSEGVTDTKGINLVIPASLYSDIAGTGASKQTGIGKEMGESLVLSEEDSWVEYTVDIPQDGFYQMGMTYYAMEGKRSSVLRDLRIDGKYPFIQAKKLEFMRMWKEAGPVWKDNQGNEFNPRQEEVSGWQYADFRDSESKVYEPLRFHLTQGKHTIRMTAIREPAAIGELRIFSPVHMETYADVEKSYKEKGYKDSKRQLIKVQAESAVIKSSPTLRRIENRDPATEPFNQQGVGLNTFGGSSWRSGGQWAEWSFEAPESGLYEIGIRNGSWFLDGIPVQRKILIDGKVPFQELNAVNFEYSGNWQLKKLGGSGGEPYSFYLEKGKHTLRMEVQVGALGQIFENVQSVSQRMSMLNREIILYTGTNPDPNRDWELGRNVPNLVQRLHMMARDLDDSIHIMYELGVRQGSSQISPLGIARDQLLNMAAEPDTIPGRLKQMSDTQTSLGTWINGLSQQALQLDYFVIKSKDEAWPKVNAGWFSKTMTSAHDFLLSFSKDYRGVGNVYDNDKTLDVWVSYGRDWAAIIKQLADEDFTANTGIKVNINVIPAGDKNKLLLSTTTGLQPDLALGVDGQVPIDFAIRNALVNLNKFPDYAETAGRFRPGALIPYKYNGGDYALPENQNFNMLFYRKDIMEQLGVTKIPDTWEDVMDLIPLLQQKGMDFYYPHAPLNPDLAINEFSPFLYQNGGDYYKEDGKSSNLSSPEAMQAFKMWTGLFTNFKINKDANFYNRFRTGEMPIGIADYSTYVLLSTAAPELTGWWGMKPMPGIKQADGQINRSTGGLAQTAIIFQQSDKQENAWKFVKWWTSADVQEQFGTELEALLGVEARWNTANVEALKRLPWPTEDIDSILEQWNWFKERQIVLGGYYTTRTVANTWNEIVLNGKNQREAIEDGVIAIDKELNKKREEFGLDTAADPSKNGEGGKDK